jgi:hypothetical protein
MTERHITPAERVEALLGKHIGHQTVTFIMRENAVVVYGNSASLLPSVLERIESKIYRLCRFAGFVFKDAEHAAFFV